MDTKTNESVKVSQAYQGFVDFTCTEGFPFPG